MKTLEMSKATAALADYARDMDDEPLVVTDRGRPVAMLVPIGNTDAETASLSTNPKFLAIIERSRRMQDTQGGISSDEMRERLRTKTRRGRADANVSAGVVKKLTDSAPSLSTSPKQSAAIRAEKRRRVEAALQQTKGNQAAAARLLGMSRLKFAGLVKTLA